MRAVLVDVRDRRVALVGTSESEFFETGRGPEPLRRRFERQTDPDFAIGSVDTSHGTLDAPIASEWSGTGSGGRLGAGHRDADVAMCVERPVSHTRARTEHVFEFDVVPHVR